ncbi:putative ATP-dependent RNA helicase TDRD9 [Arapaima gigas]
MMKEAITAEQISDWFTHVRAAEQLPPRLPEDSVGLGNTKSDKDAKGTLDSEAQQSSNSLSEAPPPLLANYNYPTLPITKDREKVGNAQESGLHR